MKAQLLRVQNSHAASFDVRYEEASVFHNPWHYHPELELTLILESKGVRFVGDSIEVFEAGDLVLLGANLPHYWRNDPAYYHAESTLKARAIILRFKLDLWGMAFLNAPEMKEIRDLFQQAARGIHFAPKQVAVIQPLLFQLLNAKDGERIRLWVHIFEHLAAAPSYRLLSQISFVNSHPSRDSQRIQKVLTYVQEHLSDPITLEEVAASINMNVSAFCRYFKQQTNKTFIQLVNELRVNNACRLLLSSDLDVGQIAFECGFNTVSHFNAIFKKQTGLNPGEHRRKFS